MRSSPTPIPTAPDPLTAPAPAGPPERRRHESPTPTSAPPGRLSIQPPRAARAAWAFLRRLLPPRRRPSPAVTAALARRLRIERDRLRAPALLAELRALPPSERESMAAVPRFRSVALAELLVAESLAAAGAAPEPAILALRIASLLDPAEVGATQVEHLTAAAWAALADARRRAGNLLAAERAFACAARHLASDPDPLEEAAFCRLLSLFRRDRGEPSRAVAAQWRAVRLLLAFARPWAIGAAVAELAALLASPWMWRARGKRRARGAA
ncbi:MAG TPA: hypothetical protein VHQ90_06400 [Thermoanaerobaculia bacterium]|nr:hypothetical protein [Thermoanaerobaculia bacterium]